MYEKRKTNVVPTVRPNGYVACLIVPEPTSVALSRSFAIVNSDADNVQSLADDAVINVAFSSVITALFVTVAESQL